MYGELVGIRVMEDPSAFRIVVPGGADILVATAPVIGVTMFVMADQSIPIPCVSMVCPAGTIMRVYRRRALFLALLLLLVFLAVAALFLGVALRRDPAPVR